MVKKKAEEVGQTSSEKSGSANPFSAGMISGNFGVAAYRTRRVPRGIKTPGDDGLVLKAVANKKCFLLSMSTEVRQKIWAYTIKEEKVIAPKQIKFHSNKFVPSLVDWSMSHAQVLAKGEVSLEPMPIAVNMSLTCHQLYNEIMGACLFYQINEFEFNDFGQMLAYLVAITPNRANAIRSVRLIIGGWRRDINAVHAFNMLANCEGLRKLTLRVLLESNWHYLHMRQHDLIPSSSTFRCIRGLTHFVFECGTGSDEHSMAHPVDPDHAYEVLEDFRKGLEANAIQPRLLIPYKKIQAAEKASGLNIYGEGRLGPDKKPGIVASRTRGQLAKQKELDDDGLGPDVKEVPKFGQFGDLLWDIANVTETREVSTDQGKSGIEILVTWANRSPQSWELLEAVVNSENVFRIVRYYMYHTWAFDIHILMATINGILEKCPEKTMVLEDLAVAIEGLESKEISDELNERILKRRYTYRFDLSAQMPSD